MNPSRLFIHRPVATSLLMVALLLAGNTYPSLKRQAELLDKPFAEAVGKTAEFLRAQGKVEQVQSSYLPYVTSRFVNAALK